MLTGWALEDCATENVRQAEAKASNGDLKRRNSVAITLTGQGPRGEMPYWHQVGDTVEKIKPEVLGRAYAFTWAFVRALDERA